jgi:hypothetical protein
MKGLRDETSDLLAPELRRTQPGVLGAVRGWWSRTVARLREGYEAQLLEDAQAERGRPNDDMVRGRDPIPFDIRPRPLGYGVLLRPVFLQFTLPCLALLLLVKVTHSWTALTGASLARIGIWILIETLFLNWMGGWLFRQRWDRLKDEGYERWRWRAEAFRAEWERLPSGAPDERRPLGA